MGLGLKRNDLRAMAQAKLADATLLFANGRFSSAYYLAGYTVELGLKACIAAQISVDTLPDKALIKHILKHEFPVLIGLAGLAEELREEQDRDDRFAANWAIVSEWNPDARYETKDAGSAQLLLGAIADPNSGVLKWIRVHW